MMSDDSGEFDDYSRGMMLALTDALALLATTGPQATIAAADMPSPPAEDKFTHGRRAGAGPGPERAAGFPIPPG